jgi:uncharacterized circularly permuted ATP-grasp superfamily protein
MTATRELYDEALTLDGEPRPRVRAALEAVVGVPGGMWIGVARLDVVRDARLLGEAWRAASLGLVNAFGTGVADVKLAHAYVEDTIRFYLGEEPLPASVPTYDLARPEVLERALDVFDVNSSQSGGAKDTWVLGQRLRGCRARTARAVLAEVGL